MKIASLAIAAGMLSGAVPALAQDQVVRIGLSGPLTGANAFAGKDNENGVRLAVEELNARKIKAGGKAVRFELRSEDDQGDPKAGVNVAQKFADAGVKFVLGPYNSGVAIPASRVYHDAGILMSTVGTSPKITQARYPNVFRIVASDTQVGAMLDKQAGGPAFKARYKQRFGREPDVYAPAFYDQAMFIAQAIQDANSVDAAAVGKVLHTASYTGVAGTYGYDAAGNLKKTAVTVYTFKGGQLAPLASY